MIKFESNNTPNPSSKLVGVGLAVMSAFAVAGCEDSQVPELQKKVASQDATIQLTQAEVLKLTRKNEELSLVNKDLAVRLKQLNRGNETQESISSKLVASKVESRVNEIGGFIFGNSGSARYLSQTLSFVSSGPQGLENVKYDYSGDKYEHASALIMDKFENGEKGLKTVGSYFGTKIEIEFVFPKKEDDIVAINVHFPGTGSKISITNNTGTKQEFESFLNKEKTIAIVKANSVNSVIQNLGGSMGSSNNYMATLPYFKYDLIDMKPTSFSLGFAFWMDNSSAVRMVSITGGKLFEIKVSEPNIVMFAGAKYDSQKPQDLARLKIALKPYL